MDEAELQHLYAWIDEVPLSRPKRNITRDFSDGVLVAEVVHHFVPRLVELHNYSPASSSKQKQGNWQTLNTKVFKKLGLNVPENVVKGVISNKAGVVEVVLSNLRVKIEQYLQKRAGVDAPIGSQASWGEFEVKKKRRPKKLPGMREPENSFNSIVTQAEYDEVADPAQALMDKDQTIMDYQETVEILQVKVRKLEQLVKLKDKRIDELSRKLAMYES